MSFWLKNAPQNLKVISESPEFELFYMKAGTAEFIEITSPKIFLGDSLYTIEMVFAEIGTYLIKLKNDTEVKYNELKVITPDEFMKINTDYSVKYSGAYLNFDK